MQRDYQPVASCRKSNKCEQPAEVPIPMFLHQPALSRLRWGSLRQITLCCDQRLEEQMNFIFNGGGLRNRACDLAAKGNGILLAQPMDQRIYRGFTDSKRCCRLLVGIKSRACARQK